ncbi:hypothetical protein PAPYR_9675 [Paratrimastix pyriformis]|uniref:Uncharacterized protein n=1 Tax=Paratrimastix pyriformis TaxID=342808 RepID=A0ABQ8UDD1_9EUKA|nr:hypothetical protein PAPYR_9675 [Paratrimastix pyriformis]
MLTSSPTRFPSPSEEKVKAAKPLRVATELPPPHPEAPKSPVPNLASTPSRPQLPNAVPPGQPEALVDFWLPRRPRTDAAKLHSKITARLGSAAHLRVLSDFVQVSVPSSAIRAHHIDLNNIRFDGSLPLLQKPPDL